VCLGCRKVRESLDDHLVRHAEPLFHVGGILAVAGSASGQIENQNSLLVGQSLPMTDRDVKSTLTIRKRKQKFRVCSTRWRQELE
jgi:hypothetical protein